jgi:hypothetical protein
MFKQRVSGDTHESFRQVGAESDTGPCCNDNGGDGLSTARRRC